MTARLTALALLAAGALLIAAGVATWLDHALGTMQWGAL